MPVTVDGASDDRQRELLSRIIERDSPALSRLYSIYCPRLTRFLTRLTPRQDVVEEVINDTMLTVWNKAASFRAESKISTWIMGIAYRRALKALRRTAVRATVDTDDVQLAPDLHKANEDREWLYGALEELPLAQRAVVELCYLLGHSCEEIAAIMECPANTVKTRLFQAPRDCVIHSRGSPARRSRGPNRGGSEGSSEEKTIAAVSTRQRCASSPSGTRSCVALASLLAAGPVHGSDIVLHASDGDTKRPIARAVEVPADATLIFHSGIVASPADPKAPEGSSAYWGDTKNQILRVFARIKASSDSLGVQFGDVIAQSPGSLDRTSGWVGHARHAGRGGRDRCPSARRQRRSGRNKPEATARHCAVVIPGFSSIDSGRHTPLGPAPG